MWGDGPKVDDAQTAADAALERSRTMAAAGQERAALANVKQAIRLYRLLATEDPAVYRPDLAMSLQVESDLASAAGKRKEALASAREAVDLFRELAKASEPARPDSVEHATGIERRSDGPERTDEWARGAGPEPAANPERSSDPTSSDDLERGDVPDRADDLEFADGPQRGDGPEPAANPGFADGPQRSDGPEPAANPGFADGSQRGDGPEPADGPQRSDVPDRADGPEPADDPERADYAERADQLERSDDPDLADDPEDAALFGPYLGSALCVLAARLHENGIDEEALDVVREGIHLFDHVDAEDIRRHRTVLEAARLLRNELSPDEHRLDEEFGALHDRG